MIDGSAKTLNMSSEILKDGIVDTLMDQRQFLPLDILNFLLLGTLTFLWPYQYFSYEAEDNKGLLKAAIRSNEVFVFLENENLHK